jgi:hypothetical protein
MGDYLPSFFYQLIGRSPTKIGVSKLDTHIGDSVPFLGSHEFIYGSLSSHCWRGRRSVAVLTAILRLKVFTLEPMRES